MHACAPVVSTPSRALGRLGGAHLVVIARDEHDFHLLVAAFIQIIVQILEDRCKLPAWRTPGR